MKKRNGKKNFIWLLILISCLFVATTTNAFAEDVTSIEVFKGSMEKFSEKKFLLTNPKVTDGISGDLFAFSNLSSGEASSAELLNFSWEFTEKVFYRVSVPTSICEFSVDESLSEIYFSVIFDTKNLEETKPETERILANLIELKDSVPQSFLKTMLNGGNVKKIIVYLSSDAREKLDI